MRKDQVQGIEVTLHIGCPNWCEYCPQSLLLSRYQGPCDVTLAEFQQHFSTVPVSKHLTFMGQGEQFVNPDASKIMLWAHQRGHQMSLSTTLSHTTHEDIDALAHIPFRTTVIHVPADDGKMRVVVDDAYLDRLKHAIAAWRHCDDFIISVFGIAHPKVRPIWAASGVPVVNYGLQDRAGNIPHLWHHRQSGKLPICGKLFVGAILPNGDVTICCNDYSMECVWGNLKQQTYASVFETDKFRAFIKSLESPDSDVICRRCNDSFKAVNAEDRSRVSDSYELR